MQEKKDKIEELMKYLYMAIERQDYFSVNQFSKEISKLSEQILK
ncbi:MAG: hypothetical protein QM504_14510 [Pseudomonadota bacterium]